jgi:hypothetical protein
MFLRAVDCGRTLVNPDLMFDKTRCVNRMRVTKGLMIPGKKQGSPATFNSIAEIRDRVIHQNVLTRASAMSNVSASVNLRKSGPAANWASKIGKYDF